VEEEQERLRVSGQEKDSWLVVLLEQLLPPCSQQRAALVTALQNPGPVPPPFQLSSLCLAVQTAPPAKRLVSEAEMRRLEELRQGGREWRERSPLARHQVDSSLSPPHQFRVTRRVGSDGLLVAWSPPDQEEVRGYQIFCGGRLVQRVRSASRTKALLHGVALAEPTTFRIHSVKDGEVLSPPIEVHYSPSMDLPKERKTSRVLAE